MGVRVREGGWWWLWLGAAGAVAADVDDDDTLVHEPGAAAVVIVGVVVAGVAGYLDNLDHLYSLFLEYCLEDYVAIVLYVLH